MAKYLREIDLLTINLPETLGSSLSRECRCIIYSINKSMKRRIPSGYSKLAVYLWSPDSLDREDCKARNIYDGFSSVALINKEVDLEKYSEMTTFKEKEIFVFNLIAAIVSSVPPDVGLDSGAFMNVLSEVRQRGGVFFEESGKWVSNQSKSLKAKLFVLYDYESIRLGVKYGSASKEALVEEIFFAKYEPNLSSVLNELGTISFVSETEMVYQPKSYYPPIKFMLSLGSAGSSGSRGQTP